MKKATHLVDERNILSNCNVGHPQSIDKLVIVLQSVHFDTQRYSHKVVHYGSCLGMAVQAQHPEHLRGTPVAIGRVMPQCEKIPANGRRG